MARLTLDELRKLRESKKEALLKQNDEDKMQIIVGTGTCGLAAGAKTVLDTFAEVLKLNRLEDKVLVRQTGCMGLCHSEPTVEVRVPGMPNIIYGKVDAQVAKKIVEKHLLRRQLLNKSVLERPAVDIFAAK